MKCFVESEIFGSRVKNVHDIITDNIPDDSVTILLKIFYISLAYIYIWWRFVRRLRMISSGKIWQMILLDIYLFDLAQTVYMCVIMEG